MTRVELIQHYLKQNSKIKNCKVAIRFGVSPSYISRIRSGLRKKVVKTPINNHRAFGAALRKITTRQLDEDVLRAVYGERGLVDAVLDDLDAKGHKR